MSLNSPVSREIARFAGDRTRPGDKPEVILVGHPNVGKSVIFSLLTGHYVTVSNYPGTTVEISRGTARIRGSVYQVWDTPGIHTLFPLSQDERVTRDLILEKPGATIIQVADVKNLAGSLQLTLQLLEMRVPLVLCLNMCDEADERGIRVDVPALEARLGVPVVAMVAIRKKGLMNLKSTLSRAAIGSVFPVRYNDRVEKACADTIPLIPASPVHPRSLALMVLCGDDTLREWLRGRVPTQGLERISEMVRGLRQGFPEPVSYLLDRRRLARAESLASEVQTRRQDSASGRNRWWDRLSLHPLWGFPVLGAILFLVYLFVGIFGAGVCVDFMEGKFFGEWVNPWAVRLVEFLAPSRFLRDLFVGPYGLITMGLTYALAIVLPIVGTFFLAFGFLEDSGYFPRLAVLLNRALRPLGVNGKAVLPMVLGLGCGTMATLTTRILETRKERATAIILLAVGIPCSSQLAVIFALLAVLSPVALLIWLGVVLMVLLLVGSLAARLIPGRSSDFILQIPPLRFPRIGNIVSKTVARVEWYLREAVPLFLMGTALLFLLDWLGGLTYIEAALSPVVVRLLGLPGEATSAFLLGFLRRDFGAAGLFLLQDQGSLDPVQTLVSVVTLTLFLPCIAQFFMIIKERKWRFAVAVMAFTTFLAVGVGAFLHVALRALGVSLE